LVEICFLKRALIFIYPHKGDKNGLHPIFGILAGLLILTVLILLDYVLQ
jgi:hypothetical protein